MSTYHGNSGIIFGHNATVKGGVIGKQTIGQQHNHGPEPKAGATTAGPDSRSGQRRADVGILTVLAEEMTAVTDFLERVPDYRTEQLYGGAQVHEATFPVAGGGLRLVAMQTLEPGTHSAALAYRELRRLFQPPIVLLVGIAGGVHAKLSVGDVVISDQVVYYDSRRVTEHGVQRRARVQAMEPVLRHRLNEFFRRQGATIRPEHGPAFGLHRGPIGTGDAVVTDAGSDIRVWLREVNEKTLAVETEAGGVAQAFYEEIDRDNGLRGWLTIRGISDLADRHKGHSHHELAARHAAIALERLLPFLVLVEAGR